MLPARAAEAGERVAADVMAPRDRDLADCRGHVVDGDFEESFGNFLEALAPDCIGDLLQPHSRSVRVERLIAVRSEHAREMIRVDAAEEQVAIGDGERSAIAIAGRSRVRAGGLRPDAKAHSVEAADRPATRRDGVDLHHRRADARSGDDALVG